MNIGQIPAHGELGEKIRSCFIAKEGYKITGGDFSNLELVLLAEFSQDPLWLKIFSDGRDLHSELASLTFNIPITKVKEFSVLKPDWSYRSIQKTLNYAIPYGSGDYRISGLLDISKKEAQDLINKFFKSIPKVKQFLDKVGELGKRRGFIKSAEPYSRVRWFSTYKSWYSQYDKYRQEKEDFINLGEMERASKNHVMSSTNADIIKMALIHAQRVIDENNYPVNILLAIYDEIRTECREDFAEEWKNILADIMIKEAQVIIKTIPVKVEMNIADYWSK